MQVTEGTVKHQMHGGTVRNSQNSKPPLRGDGVQASMDGIAPITYLQQAIQKAKHLFQKHVLMQVTKGTVKHQMHGGTVQTLRT